MLLTQLGLSVVVPCHVWSFAPLKTFVFVYIEKSRIDLPLQRAVTKLAAAQRLLQIAEIQIKI